MPRKRKDDVQVDYSDKLEAELPPCRALALEEKQLEAALEKLFALEKLTRQGGDWTSCKKVAKFIVRLCYDMEDYDQLKNSLSVIAKRRGQEHQVIQEAVQEAMALMADMSKEQKLDLIATLRIITEGKIFVELERAQLTKTLAQIKEADGDLKGAAKVLQDVQVETLGKMEKRDKVEYVLEQVRLCLDSEDYMRAQILSRKVNPSVLKGEDFQEVKLRYYHTMIRYHLHKKDFLEVCRAYQHIYDTDIVKEDQSKRDEALKLATTFCVLSKHDPEQKDITQLLYDDKNLETLGAYRALLKLFIRQELINWPAMKEQYTAVFNSLKVFQDEPSLWDHLQSRVIEHNIRIIAQYYTRISYDRFADLLNLGPEEAEKRLSEMVVEDAVYALMDRPAGIVSFARRKAPADVLNDWSGGISELLNLLEKTCHLIHRESIVHGSGR